MSRNNKFIEKLSKEQKRSLEKGYKTGKGFTFRRNCHAILLSHEGQTVNEIAGFFGVSTITVYAWLKKWQTDGIEGLKHKPGQGRPAKLKLDDEKHVKTVKILVENEPKNLNRVVGQLKSELGLDLSKKTLKRFLKNLNTAGNDSEED
jgi:transposase